MGEGGCAPQPHYLRMDGHRQRHNRTGALGKRTGPLSSPQPWATGASDRPAGSTKTHTRQGCFLVPIREVGEVVVRKDDRVARAGGPEPPLPAVTHDTQVVCHGTSVMHSVPVENKGEKAVDLRCSSPQWARVHLQHAFTLAGQQADVRLAVGPAYAQELVEPYDRH
jgi:hypothetical protein